MKNFKDETLKEIIKNIKPGQIVQIDGKNYIAYENITCSACAFRKTVYICNSCLDNSNVTSFLLSNKATYNKPKFNFFNFFKK